MIKINLLKEIEKSKKVELEPKEKDLVPIQELENPPQELEIPQTEPEIINEEELETADNFDDVEEKETLVEDVEKLQEEIEVENSDDEPSFEEQVEEKRSPFRPIKFDTTASIEDEEKIIDEENIAKSQEPAIKVENDKIEPKEEKTVMGKDSETIKVDTKIEEIPKEQKQEVTSVEEPKDSINEDEEESVLIDEEKPAIPFRVVESSIEEDDDEATFDDFTGSKMPHILVAIAIFAVIGASGYYLWTINDDLVETVAEGVPSEEYQEEIPTETATNSEETKSDQEISSILEEDKFEFDEKPTAKIDEPVVEETKTVSETQKPKQVVPTPPVQKPIKKAPETTFTTSGNVNFDKITLPNALILKREVKAGEFKITCFSQKKFTRSVVAEFKKRGGYSQLNINVRTDIRDGKIGDLVVFTGKN